MACYLTCSLYVTNMIDTCGSPSPYLKKVICSIYYTHTQKSNNNKTKHYSYCVLSVVAYYYYLSLGRLAPDSIGPNQGQT